MSKKTETETRAQVSMSAVDPLVMRLKSHYQKMSPHVKKKKTATLLLEAIRQIEQLNNAIDTMPHCKIASDGVLLVPVDRYNRIEIANA